MNWTPDDLAKLLGLLDVTETEEIDCAEFLHRIAAYVESLGPSGAPPEGTSAVVQHLRVCPECCEEFLALREALRAEHPQVGGNRPTE